MQVTDIPSWLADEWTITVDAASVILSVVVILFVMLPVFIVARGKSGVVVELIMLFLTMSFLVGIQWLPFWVLIVAITIAAAGTARVGVDVIMGD